jgi:hypothetical protein
VADEFRGAGILPAVWPSTTKTKIAGETPAPPKRRRAFTNHELQITHHNLIALTPRQGLLDAAEPVIHVRELVLEIIEPVKNGLIVV